MQANQRATQRLPLENQTHAAPLVSHNPQWTALSNALKAGFSATEAKYMLDLSDEQMSNYFRCQREAAG
ncbi:hypothetical protein [Aurantimonas coralicida]|uniref:Replication A protein n=1 Tax=Aurantimonas coralicida TaxID=182270 RepID=A0A0P0YZ69_9HYPH|nr:hypothetical protein [Aurantimonas coralicida]BAT26863.1 replication A protein [Aurantimonas coralicida]